jgi:hypothetical protein
VRLDFFRGAALLVILYDHLLGEAQTALPIYVQMTPFFWGLACAAIIFVFISGQVYGLVYGSIFDRRGLKSTVLKSARRTGELYFANFVTFAAVWLVVRLVRGPGFADGALPAQIGLMAERWGGQIGAMFAFARFADAPELFDVLPLYMILVAAGPPILWGLSRWPRSTLLVSAAIYAAAQFGLAFPMEAMGLKPFYFNPCAWQIVFVGGIAIARFKPVIGRSMPVVIAGIILIVVVALQIWAIPYAQSKGYLGRLPPWQVNPAWHDRTNLHFVRILYFGVLTYIVMQFLPKQDWFWNLALVRALRMIGRHTLPCFCVGVWFTWVSEPILVHFHGLWFHAIAAFGIGTGLTGIVALFAERRKQAAALAAAATSPA